MIKNLIILALLTIMACYGFVNNVGPFAAIGCIGWLITAASTYFEYGDE